MRLVERIRKYLIFKGVTPYEFEKKIKVGSGYLIKQAAGKGAVGSDILERIHKQYPSLNILWVLTGSGEMEHPAQNIPTQNGQPAGHPKDKFDENRTENGLLVEKLKMQEKITEILTQQNAVLLAANADKERVINLLELRLKDFENRAKN